MEAVAVGKVIQAGGGGRERRIYMKRELDEHTEEEV